MDHHRTNHHLGVNKAGKSIRKSPLHQPNYPRPPPPQHQQNNHLQPPPPQPQVYNISKNEFRSIVQQLTGTPSRDQTPPPPLPSLPNRPPHPKPPSMRLQKFRPPPLTPIARPPPPPFQNPNPNHNFFPRPSPVAESPVSAYMKYLESSLLHSDGSRPHAPSPHLLPSPPPFSNPNPNPGLLPSPGLPPPPSPSSFLNLLSPKSPYPLLSPGFQYPPPLTPNFFSPGILGPGPGQHPAPPRSPGLMFPQSPSGFFPLLSPRWRDM